MISSAEGGTSPHTRGSRALRRPRTRRRGNIPAYAGITLRIECLIKLHGEHPRIRGDHATLDLPMTSRAGTSPHTRGSLLHGIDNLDVIRNIPAYAGITACQAMPQLKRREHPRIRGDHGMRTATSSTRVGTSPHTRGSQLASSGATVDIGNIPAYAGITSVIGALSMAWWEHPRIRGDHDALSTVRFSVTGTSPHTRGSRLPRGHSALNAGNIPAYAGITRMGCAGEGGGREHPRIRGDHGGGWTSRRWHQGTSPHTRGSLLAALRDLSRVGNIPAYAGITRIPPRSRFQAGEHPRIRGDHRAMPLQSRSAPGTSPHTRGSPR